MPEVHFRRPRVQDMAVRLQQSENKLAALTVQLTEHADAAATRESGERVCVSEFIELCSVCCRAPDLA